MTVMFSYTGDFERVASVYYLDEEHKLVIRHVKYTNGRIDDVPQLYETLGEAFQDLNSGSNPLYIAKVADLKTAFRYVGKPVDFVHMLPKGNLDEPNEATG